MCYMFDSGWYVLNTFKNYRLVCSSKPMLIIDTTRSTIESIETELQTQGMQCFETTVGGSGVQGLWLPNDKMITAKVGCGFAEFASTPTINWTTVDSLFPSTVEN